MLSAVWVVLINELIELSDVFHLGMVKGSATMFFHPLKNRIFLIVRKVR